jgi:hypothetical protein
MSVVGNTLNPSQWFLPFFLTRDSSLAVVV